MAILVPLPTKQRASLKTKFSDKSFAEFLHHSISYSFFMTATNGDELKNIISKLNENKSTGSNSLPTKILKQLKNNIFLQMADTFNISFSSVVFCSHLHIAKIVALHKKNSNLICSNYIGQCFCYHTLIKF